MASKPSVSASKDALAAIFGKDSQKAQVGSQPESGEEPESGVQGKGTVDEPYDQGNAPEQGKATKPFPVPSHTIHSIPLLGMQAALDHRLPLLSTDIRWFSSILPQQRRGLRTNTS